MDNQQWFDNIREHLIREHLPQGYVERFTGELRDHLEDSSENGVDGDASSCLGEWRQVAGMTVTAYRRRSFLGRHSWAAFLVFVVTPAISLEVVFFVLMVLWTAFSGTHTIRFREDHGMLCLMLLAGSSFAGCLYDELAMWLAIRKKWVLVSCGMLGAAAMLLEFGFMGTATVMLLVQFAAPAVVVLGTRNWRRRQGFPATTLLLFLGSPVAMYLILMAAAALLLAALEPALLWLYGGANAHTALVVLAGAMSILVLFLPAVGTSVFYCRLVRRLGIDRRWMLAACFLLAVAIEVLFSRQMATTTFTSEHHGEVSIGLVMCLILGFGQALVPLSIAWWYMRRCRGQVQPKSDSVETA